MAMPAASNDVADAIVARSFHSQVDTFWRRLKDECDTIGFLFIASRHAAMSERVSFLPAFVPTSSFFRPPFRWWDGMVGVEEVSIGSLLITFTALRGQMCTSGSSRAGRWVRLDSLVCFNGWRLYMQK